MRERSCAVQGDIQSIDAIPDEVKAIYKTSFQLSPYAFLEVAARAQKWIDQAISRNMYLETRDLGDMMDIYYAAWERGVKTTYYLHMKPRHTAEQSTVKVNKAEDIDGQRRPRLAVADRGAAARARRGAGASWIRRALRSERTVDTRTGRSDGRPAVRQLPVLRGSGRPDGRPASARSCQ